MGDTCLPMERVLIVFYQGMPASLEQHIRSKFSDAEVAIYRSQENVPVPAGEEISSSQVFDTLC